MCVLLRNVQLTPPSADLLLYCNNNPIPADYSNLIVVHLLGQVLSGTLFLLFHACAARSSEQNTKIDLLENRFVFGVVELLGRLPTTLRILDHTVLKGIRGSKDAVLRPDSNTIL